MSELPAANIAPAWRALPGLRVARRRERHLHWIIQRGDSIGNPSGVAGFELLLNNTLPVVFTGTTTTEKTMFDLSTIKRSTQLPPRVVVYGVPGIGKTTLAADMPNPIFLPVEDGLGQLDVEAFPRPSSYDEVIEAITSLIQGDHNYQTLVIDSLDKLEPIIHDHVCETVPNDKGQKVDLIESYGWAKGYTHAISDWRRLLRGLDVLREQRGMAICLIAHSAVVRFESPEADPYERYQLQLHKKADAAVCEWADCVLFCNYKITVIDGGGNTDKKRGVGKGERLLHTNERPAFKAKNRYSLPDTLPLSWSELAPLLTPKPKAKRKAKPATLVK